MDGSNRSPLLLLGGWWMEAAKRGGPDSIPVVNVHALEEQCRQMSLNSNSAYSHGGRSGSSDGSEASK